jgi:hypothetical protein
MSLQEGENLRCSSARAKSVGRCGHVERPILNGLSMSIAVCRDIKGGALG